ncbi:MAG: type II toxin-antitoxin system prevent-host-death family antitoxin [Nitrococcus sp.]|nr:type II toxin-antitoxin system prevent-host-death family antitoxin [Nitrococcus sp.]
MRKVNVREARERIGLLLDAVEAGEEVVITRRGRPVARLSGVGDTGRDRPQFPDRRGFRAQLPPARENAVNIVRGIRDERD